MSIARHVPNALTCCNLLAGCLGIVGVIEQWPFPSAYFVWLAVFFDFLDGFAARALKTSSAIGKELDSLADMVSFGVLPALTMYYMMKNATDISYLPLLAFSLAVFSAVRLAKFNIDERQIFGFIGLPTPANALLVTGLPLMQVGYFGIEWSIASLVIITIGMSWLMVSPIPLIALKFKHLRWKDNQIRFTLLALSVLLLAILGSPGIVPVIIMYVLLSLVGLWWGADAVTSK